MKRFELLSIIGSVVAVGITFGVVVLGSVANLRAEVRTDIAGVRTEMQSLRTEVRADIRALEHRFVAMERRQARTEGVARRAARRDHGAAG